MMSGIFTALLLTLFVCVWIWAWGAARRQPFGEAARLPLEDDAAAKPAREVRP